MLLHGDADKVVPVSASRRFEERVREAGGKVDLHVYAGLPHGFANHPEIRPAMMRMIGGFFRRWAIAPEVFEAAPAAQARPQAVPAA
jgi:dipeptidyl aminopeptidase/acylaminoacyl peptidase